MTCSFRCFYLTLFCGAAWALFAVQAKADDVARRGVGLSAAAIRALIDDQGASSADSSDDDPDSGTPRVVPRIGPDGRPIRALDDKSALPESPVTDSNALQLESGGTQPGTNDAIAPPQTTTRPLPSELEPLRDKVRSTITWYYPKHLNTRDHSPWEVMHGIISYGVNAQMFRGGPQGEKINAISWLCGNRPCEGERIFDLGRDGRILARRGPGLQGHGGQLLAILAQSYVKSDYPLVIDGKQFTIQDLIEEEKLDCRAGEELTFKLIALSHYLDSDATWVGRDGQQWSIQRLIEEELKAPIRGAACGGTHRLMGLSYSVKKRIKADKPVVGQWRRAQIFLNDYHRYTFSLQNPDGSFSTEWFTRRGSNPDVDRRLKTSGHILEWISFSLSDEELLHPRTVKAANYLATILEQDKNRSWEVGPLGHGLHALILYDARVFKPADPSQSVARSGP